MKYYPARFLNVFDSADEALHFAGFSEDEAERHIAAARTHQSDLIVIDLGDGKGLAVRKNEAGIWELWKAVLGLVCESSDEAQKFAHDINEQLNDGQSTWAVFQWTPPTSAAAS